MADLATSAAAASLIVGMLTIPAASTTLDSSATSTQSLPDISSSNSTPVEVQRETSSSGFQASIQTAFDRFTLETSPSSTEAELEQPTSRLEVDKTPSTTSWKLTTSSGTLKVTKTGNGVTEKVKTPQGTLEIIRENGATAQNFNGEDRQAVVSTYHKLRDAMNQKKKQLDQKRQRLEERSQPEIEVTANESTASGFGNDTFEHVVIANEGLKEVQLNGWTLEDDSGSFELPAETLEPGEQIKVYTSDSDEIDAEESAIYGSDLAWNNGGDTATLSNGKGEVLAAQAY